MNYKHGGKHTALYVIWGSMKSRCGNPANKSYKDYGARGIAVCAAWDESFDAFRRDMGERPTGASIERLDNDKGYEPSNCVWATRSQQGRNRRSTRMITANGVTRSMAEWAEVSGLKLPTIWRRLSTGWGECDAVTVPLVPHKERMQRKTFCAMQGVRLSDERIAA